jgi:plastocyanin domain-containing protein
MKNTKKLIKFSGILIVILGILMANRGFTLLGVNIPINNLLSFNSKNSSNVITDENKATVIDGKQVVKIKATSSGYSPRVVFIEKNLPTEIIFEGETITSCNNEVIFPSMNIKQKLTKGETKINFTAGDKDISYSCWMGMLSGSIKVVDTLDGVSDKDISSAESELSQNSGGGCCQGSSSNQSQEFLVYGLPLTEIPTDRLVKKSSISGSSQALSISGIDTYFEPLVSILKTNIPAKLTFNLTKMSAANGTYNIVEFSSQEIVGSFTISDFKGSIDITLNKSSIYFIEKDFSIVGTIKTSDSPETEDIENVRSELID